MFMILYINRKILRLPCFRDAKAHHRLFAERHVTKPENRSHRIRLSENVLTAVRTTDYDIYGFLR